MTENTAESARTEPTDIVFDCPHCGKSLAIDRGGAGLFVTCPDCAKQIKVPPPPPLPPPSFVPPPPPRGTVKAPSLPSFPPKGAALPPRSSPRADTSGANGPGVASLVIGEAELRETLRHVVKSIILIVALSFLKTISAALLPMEVSFGRLSVSSWVSVGVSIFIIGILIKLYRPVKTIVMFYLAVFIKIGKMPGRENYMGNILSVAANLTLLLFISSVYGYLRPILTVFNMAFINFGALTVIADVVVLVVDIGILLVIWKNASPLVDLLTGHITDTVTTISSSLAFVNCPRCNAKNDRDAAFCTSCGAKVEFGAKAARRGICPQCAAENPPSSRFCCKCGTTIS